MGGCYDIAKRKKRHLELVGESQDGHRVVKGVFKLVDTQGVPLEVVLESFIEHRVLVDWIDFYDSASKAGWKIKTIVEKVKYPLIDMFDEGYANTIVGRLRQYDSQKYKAGV